MDTLQDITFIPNSSTPLDSLKEPKKSEKYKSDASVHDYEFDAMCEPNVEEDYTFEKSCEEVMVVVPTPSISSFIRCFLTPLI